MAMLILTKSKLYVLAVCQMATKQIEFNMNISLPPTTNPAVPPTPYGRFSAGSI